MSPQSVAPTRQHVAYVQGEGREELKSDEAPETRQERGTRPIFEQSVLLRLDSPTFGMGRGRG